MADAAPSTELVVPGVGEIVDLNDEIACIQALTAVRGFEDQVAEAKRALSAAIIERSRILGTKTLTLPDGRKATISGDTELAWVDVEGMEEELREAGMPESRIREIIVEQVSYAVKTQEARSAAAASPDYRAIIERHQTRVPKPQYVSNPK